MPKQSPPKGQVKRPLARQRALRLLAEGAKPTLELLADASTLSVRTLRADAEREGWQLDREPEPDILARVRAISLGLLGKVEAVQAASLEEGKKIDKQEIDAMLAMIRGVEKIDEIMRSDEAAKGNQIRNDEDVADTLDRINERIVQLAMEIAAGMVARASGPGGGEAG
ncbi:hypothetical protein [Mesorhizobium sp. IMUNJ 23232]|uniref:hypothetical protein n=1 Tax=Mesorhizobium sp. IMUNJ 23232 TaxID=3376064 RepID=UPI0037B39220